MFFLLTVSVAWVADNADLTAVKKENRPKERVAEKMVSQSAHQMTDEVRMARGEGGHYWIDGEVDGTAVTFVVDTGASFISLSYEDAEKAGLDPGNLEYDGRINTANGVARIARINLSSFRVGAIEVYDVPAIVSSPGSLSVSLLGMSFLNRLDSFQVEGEHLVLRR
ncbi:retropepsin-like aspartic protease family protein [Emcibacter sp.]|uniref:retropepsin-like aspartic protease family protein n=1 Tax=Emcibacter sp. TaxID=1979954 RepID=UPI003A8EB020